MKHARLALTALFIFVVVACQSSTTWTKYTSTKGNFSILMPDIPKEEHETKDMGVLGQIGLFNYVAEGSYGSFAVGYIDFPEDKVRQVNPYDLLDAALTGASTAVFKKIQVMELSRSKINWQNKFPGREIRLKTVDESETGVIRLYLVNARLFMISAAEYSSGYSESEIQNYLDSFTLLRS